MKHHRSHRQPREDERASTPPPSRQPHVEDSSSKSRAASSSRRSSSVKAASCADSFLSRILAARSSGCDRRSLSISTHSISDEPGNRSIEKTTTCCRRVVSSSSSVSPNAAEARSRRLARAKYSASSYPCPPHRPHVCAMAIIGRRRRPGADFSSPSTSPGADFSSSSPSHSPSNASRHRANAAAPSLEYTKSEPHTRSHPPPPPSTNPSASFQSSALAIGKPRVPPPATLARFRSSLSRAPPSVVSVAVHDAKRDDILSASQPVPAPSSRIAASRARRRAHLSDSRYRPRTIAAGHTLPLQCDACEDGVEGQHFSPGRWRMAREGRGGRGWWRTSTSMPSSSSSLVASSTEEPRPGGGADIRARTE